MRGLALAICMAVGLFAISASAQSSHQVGGYWKQNGTYVQPHYQTNPDSTTTNNWSTKGNQNPYTGTMGDKPNSYDSTNRTYQNTYNPYATHKNGNDRYYGDEF